MIVSTIMMWVTWYLVLGTSFLFFAFVRPWGHVLVGRMLGVPWSDMRIQLLTFTPTVMLRQEGTWISPRVSPHNADEFLSVLHGYLPGVWRLFLYYGGGFLGQTWLAVGAWTIASLLECQRFGTAFVSMSFMAYILCIVGDLPTALIEGNPKGETSELWYISPLWTMVFIAGVLSIHMSLLILSLI